MPTLLALAAAAALATAGATGGDLPAWAMRLLASDFGNAAPATRPLPSKIDVAGLAVTLEQTRIEDVRRRFGGRARHGGDAGSSQITLCYDWRDGLHRSRVWLSAGEMGGSAHTIQTVALQAAVRPDNACPLLRGAVGNTLPVALSTSARRVVAIYGMSRDRRYKTEEPLRAGSRLVTLTVQVQRGRVLRLLMTQVSSF